MPEIGQTLSHFKILEKIGAGGMGTVFLAEDLTLDRKVALKFLPEAFTSDPERMARFEREAKLLASLNHPNIAGIYGLEQADGNRFLVLEYVEGETLQARLSKGALPLEDALELCRQIAEGLEAAHEKGVIHRDLKPANVMITAEEKIKILDFGLAKAFSDDTQSIDSSQSPTLTEAMTRPGVILGTAAYMSPEQAKGKSVDKRADIWAFGCILYECLTGRKAFEGETVTETLAAVIKEEPDWNALPSTTPQNIQFVLRRCLEKEKSRRFRDAADILILLEEAYDSRKVTDSLKQKRSWLWKSITIILVVAFGALFLIHFSGQSPAPEEPIFFQITPVVSIPSSGAFALSPNGRSLAYVAYNEKGSANLWIYDFNSGESRPLKGTEIATSDSLFFWSPDSRYIAYGTGGKLSKVSTLGGPSRLISNVSNSVLGGSWNHNDVIIFAEYPIYPGIMKVSASGGEPVPVTKLDPNHQEIRHLLPSFLPDGHHFIYYCISANPELSGVYIGSLNVKPEEQSRKQVIASTQTAIYVPPMKNGNGYLLFIDGKVLKAQPFDDKKLQRIGEPIPIVDQVGNYANYGFYSASENGFLIYRKGDTDLLSQPTWFDRQGNELKTVGQPGVYYRLEISPDGEHAAVSRTMPHISIFSDIWILDLLRGTEDQRLTFGEYSNSRPIWSPFGDKIVFSSDRHGISNLYQMGANKEEKPLFESGEIKIPTSWSRDGLFILYTVVEENSNTDLYVLSLKDGPKGIPLEHSKFNEEDGHFSPDMRWIAYVSDEKGSKKVYVRSFSQTSSENSWLTGEKTCVSKDGGIGPRWSDGGKELYYWTPDEEVAAVAVTADKTFNFGETEVLFKARIDPASMGSPAPFPVWDVKSDGSQFLMPVPIEENIQTQFNAILNWTSLLEQ